MKQKVDHNGSKQSAEQVTHNKVSEVENGADGMDHVTNEFVNTGLQKWEAERAKWLGRKPTERQHKGHASRWAVDVNVDEIIDLIFSNRWRGGGGGVGGAVGGSTGEKKEGEFPSPVPLPQMVDILVDLWEAEGLEI